MSCGDPRCRVCRTDRLSFAEKLRIAREARDFGRAARAGKPFTFPERRYPTPQPEQEGDT